MVKTKQNIRKFWLKRKRVEKYPRLSRIMSDWQNYRQFLIF